MDKKACKRILKVGLTFASIIGIGTFIKHVSGSANESLEKGNAKNTKKKYLNFGSAKVYTVEEEAIGNVKIKNFFGDLTIDLSKAYITNDMDIDVLDVVGGVNVIVPSGIRVMVTESGILCGAVNKVPYCDGEEIPTVFITANTIIGKITSKEEK